jgi:hypothetical protein
MVYINGLGQTRIGARPRPSGYDVDAEAFIASASLTDVTQKSAVNTLVNDLKRFGLWTKIKAFYPFVGGNATSHKFNLKDPRDSNDAYRLTFSGGWTHSSSGAQCNGSNTTSNTYLSLRSVFGATSYEHNLGVYINYYNPSWSYRNDIGAVDGSYNTNPNISLSYDTNYVYVYNLRGNRTYPDLMFSKSLAPSGLTEFKRYRKGYFVIFKNGSELNEYSSTNLYRSIAYNASFYNPVSSVYIGSAESWSRYSTAYITDALSTVQSSLMYIAVQKFQTTLGRQVGTGISSISTSYNGTAPDLVTNGLKVNLDTNSLTEPEERALTTSQPGNYYRSSSIWPDTSGNNNNGFFEKISTDWVDRIGEYCKTDIGAAEIRMRSMSPPANGIKPYSSGTSPDGLYTTYKGSSTDTFTFGGWVKANSIFNYPFFTRGNYTNTTGWGCSMILSGSLGGKFVLSNINTGGAAGSVGSVTPSGQTALSSITTMQSDVWYFVYCVWKPSSYVKIYVNGQLETTTNITHSQLVTTTLNVHGFSMNLSYSNNGSGYGMGIYGAMHVYNRELSAAEILQNFESTRRKYNV